MTQLTQIVQGAESSGLISTTIATTLLGEITSVQNAVTSGSTYHGEWEQLSSTIQSGKTEGTIPAALTVQLNSALSYLYVATGS